MSYDQEVGVEDSAATPNRNSRLCVLITNSFIASYSGSELYVRDVAVELLRRGHSPVVYGPRLGELAQEIRAATVPVIDDLALMSSVPDLIHGQHHLETMTALTHFQEVPAVFFCHGWLPWAETPPRHPRIVSYVAVNDAVRDRLVFEHGIPERRIETILNSVDLERFTPRPALPHVPRRALIFSNNAAEHNYVGIVREACVRYGLELDVIGITNGNPSSRPETLLGTYDIVFARGRAALESLAVGAAVVCCDVEGVGPMVTTGNLEWLRRNNFGLRILSQSITADSLSQGIARYDPADAAKVSGAIRAEAGLPSAVERIIDVYRSALESWASTGRRDSAAESAAVSTYLRWVSLSGGSPPEATRNLPEPSGEMPATECDTIRERAADLQAELDRVAAERHSLREKVAHLQAVIASITSTITWRVYRRFVESAPIIKPYLLMARPVKGWLARRRSIGNSSPLPGPSDEREAYPELACVVLSLGDPPTLAAAVRSLQSQNERAEIVVVNSGGGNPAETLRRAGIDVRVITREARLFPGAARNIGIEATQAPLVAFLAADCVAGPGWVEGRLRRHRTGSPAVSSAVICGHPHNPWSWVSQVYLFSRRMPGTPDGEVLDYGLSYTRTLFDRFGVFREDLRSGEDSELNERMAGKIPITWAPEVRSAHVHPTTPLALVRDQFARGARMARALRQLTGRRQEWRIARNAFVRIPDSLRLAWCAARGVDRAYVLGIALLLPPAAAVYALGALLSGSGRPESDESPREPRILALLQFRNEMRYLPDYFRNVAPQVDGIIALDDGSTDGSGEFVARQPAVLNIIRTPPSSPHVWDEPRNRRLLVEAAQEQAPDWLIAVDADERLEQNFRRHARAEIARAEREGYLAYHVKCRELWNYPDRYRVDGIWGQKTSVRFFKARHDHEFDDRLLHGYWAPLNSQHDGGYPAADLIFYHLRMICPADRLVRQGRYRQLDPDGLHQAVGYDYLTDEAGLRLEPLPEDRTYEPLVAVDGSPELPSSGEVMEGCADAPRKLSG